MNKLLQLRSNKNKNKQKTDLPLFKPYETATLAPIKNSFWHRSSDFSYEARLYSFTHLESISGFKNAT